MYNFTTESAQERIKTIMSIAKSRTVCAEDLLDVLKTKRKVVIFFLAHLRENGALEIDRKEGRIVYYKWVADYDIEFAERLLDLPIRSAEHIKPFRDAMHIAFFGEKGMGTGFNPEEEKIRDEINEYFAAMPSKPPKDD